jgi:SOS-response transcriptional repressor LexA
MATEYGTRLKTARNRLKLTQKQLEKLTGIAQSTISTAEKHGHGSTETTVLALALKVDPHWLATGEGEMEPKGSLARVSMGLDTEIKFAQPSGISNVTELDPQRIRVPLISWIQAGELSDVVDLFHPGEAVQWEDALKSKPGHHSYALLVEGDSMVSHTGAHSFPPGTVLIVDPERGANAGDYVIAKDVQTQKATFKQLTTDGARWYLKPLNAQYPTIEIDDPAMRVIGRVIEAKPPSVKL